MKLKESGLPSIVIENTPKYLRRSKVPIVKAKIGPKIMTLMCDSNIYNVIPVKKEVKATVSGIYITAVKGLRGPLETPTKKKAFWQDFETELNRHRNDKAKPAAFQSPRVCFYSFIALSPYKDQEPTTTPSSLRIGQIFTSISQSARGSLLTSKA